MFCKISPILLRISHNSFSSFFLSEFFSWPLLSKEAYPLSSNDYKQKDESPIAFPKQIDLNNASHPCTVPIVICTWLQSRTIIYLEHSSTNMLEGGWHSGTATGESMDCMLSLSLLFISLNQPRLFFFLHLTSSTNFPLTRMPSILLLSSLCELLLAGSGGKAKGFVSGCRHLPIRGKLRVSESAQLPRSSGYAEQTPRSLRRCTTAHNWTQSLSCSHKLRSTTIVSELSDQLLRCCDGETEAISRHFA